MTDVERIEGETGGEADVVVTGVVDTDTSVKSVKHVIVKNSLEYKNIKLKLKSSNEYYFSVFNVTCTGESSMLFVGAVSVVFQGERTVPQVNLIPSALDSVQPHNTFTSTKD